MSRQPSETAEPEVRAGAEAEQQHPSALEMKFEALPQLVQGLSSDDSSLQLEAIKELRELLSIELNPPIQEVVNSGAVPFFVQMLTRDDCAQIQAVRALGNVAGDSAVFHEIVPAHDVLLPLLQLLKGHPRLSLLRDCTWTLRVICRGNPQLSFEHVKSALQVLGQLIDSQDEAVLSDACSAISFMFDGCDDSKKIQALIDVKVCPRLVELLTHSSPTVVYPALSVVSRIANGNAAQIQAVIDGNIIGPLVHLMQAAAYDVKKEAAFAIANATDVGTPDQIEYLVSQGCIKAFCGLLRYSETDILAACLDGLANILGEGEEEDDFNPYAQMIEDAGDFYEIDDLKNHHDDTINGKAARKAAALLLSSWSGVGLHMIGCLRCRRTLCFQLCEGSHGLTTIAFGTAENTMVVVRHCSIPIFVKLLHSPSEEIREHARKRSNY
ncbi:hypothetical protein HU200_005368 [Digitaria exilis]|uniref:Importin subunit alpha n=1 Tax=Digitaria exilis TaxID=1010633 RepID=A0A835FS31_9POAL|nr:hypothetical protein HU200_005368 [Digitaria exilis]